MSCFFVILIFCHFLDLLLHWLSLPPPYLSIDDSPFGLNLDLSLDHVYPLYCSFVQGHDLGFALGYSVVFALENIFVPGIALKINHVPDYALSFVCFRDLAFAACPVLCLVDI